jgi:quercetin dioxygenase-like cupin family protein
MTSRPLLALAVALLTSHIPSSAGPTRGDATSAHPASLEHAVASSQAPGQPATKVGGYIIENDADVAAQQPGPHSGGGQTIGHSFFANVSDLSLVFRKRVLKPGSAIGYHRQTEDEIYYFLSGRGVMTLDGKDVVVGPGMAVLTRTGSSHGLKPLDNQDLVLIINYPRAVQH